MRIPPEFTKNLAAILSLASVGVALGISAATLSMKNEELLVSTLVVSTAVAAFAAGVSLFVKRRLSEKRQEKRIFLIYARDDRAAAKRLYDDLKRSGFNPWLDTEDIAPGEVWRQSVLRAISESALALVLISDNLYKSGFAQKEIKAALSMLHDTDHGKSPVIPVRLNDVEVPALLSHIQWVDLFREGGFQELRSALEIAETPNTGPQADG